MANLEGYFDGVYGPVIAGWAIDHEAKDTALEIQLFLDGKLAATTRANVHRPDLEQAGLGQGLYGYRFQIPADQITVETTHVEIRFKDSGDLLTRGEFDLKKTENGEFEWAEHVKQPVTTDHKSVIFLTTPTSATASMWRILSILAEGKYELNRFTDSFYNQGKIADVQHAVPPEKNNLILLNVPRWFNQDLNFRNYRFILNIRDPRDLGCNQYHWELQHPAAAKTDEEVAAHRAKIEGNGIDFYVSKMINNNIHFSSFYKVVEEMPKEDVLFATYALICMEFDNYLKSVADFLGVVPNEDQMRRLEPERIGNLSQNTKWIGNQWSGSDTMPGRFQRELKPETVAHLNERYKVMLDFLASNDHPAVRHTYLAGR